MLQDSVLPSIDFTLLTNSDIYFKGDKCIKNRYECETCSFKESIEKAFLIIHEINGYYIIYSKQEYEQRLKSLIDKLKSFKPDIEEKIILKKNKGIFLSRKIPLFNSFIYISSIDLLNSFYRIKQ